MQRWAGHDGRRARASEAGESARERVGQVCMLALTCNRAAGAWPGTREWVVPPPQQGRRVVERGWARAPPWVDQV